MAFIVIKKLQVQFLERSRVLCFKGKHFVAILCLVTVIEIETPYPVMGIDIGKKIEQFDIDTITSNEKARQICLLTKRRE